MITLGELSTTCGENMVHKPSHINVGVDFKKGHTDSMTNEFSTLSSSKGLSFIKSVLVFVSVHLSRPFVKCYSNVKFSIAF